jgi:nitrite reductase/ring-hydroxylating ferredoxin subunit
MFMKAAASPIRIGLPIRGRRLLSPANARSDLEGGEMAWIRAAAVADLKERRVMDAVIDGEEIALYWVDDAAWATDNLCTHAFARLSEGYLDGDCIECPIHQALFDVKTGAAVSAPASTPVKTYACLIDGDDVLVDIGPQSEPVAARTEPASR